MVIKSGQVQKAGQFINEQIVATLQEATRGEKTIATLCREKGISEATFYTWRQKFGGMNTREVQRLRELEKENARLKKLLAESHLDIAALKDLLSDIVLLEARQEVMTMPGARLYVAW